MQEANLPVPVELSKTDMNRNCWLCILLCNYCTLCHTPLMLMMWGMCLLPVYACRAQFQFLNLSVWVRIGHNDCTFSVECSPKNKLRLGVHGGEV